MANGKTKKPTNGMIGGKGRKKPAKPKPGDKPVTKKVAMIGGFPKKRKPKKKSRA